MSPEELAKADEIYKAIIGKERNTLVKRYGKDAEKVAKGRAVKQAQKLAEKKMDSSKDKLREMVQAALMQEKAGFTDQFDNNPALKGGQKNLPDGLQKSIITKAKGKMKEALSSNSNYSEYSNDALTDMIINLSRYEGTEDLVKRVKDELENRRKKAKGEMKEDLDLGHTDNEPHMLKSDLYHIGKYAMDLYQMVDQFEGMGEVDFPHWWQSKIIKAKEMMSSAKHYLDFETKEPEIDTMVGAVDAISMNEAKQEPVMIDGKEVNIVSIEPSNISPDDYPDFSDAYAANAEFMDGTELTDEQLAMLDDQYPDLIRNAAEDYLTEKKLTKPELKKREEIAKAMKKGDPKMDMEKKMAIATSIAKRVAERLKK
jgi:hypothetical protein